MSAPQTAEKTTTTENHTSFESLTKEVANQMRRASDEMDRLRLEVLKLKKLSDGQTETLLEVLENVEEWMQLAVRAKQGASPEARQLAASLIVEKLFVFELPEGEKRCDLCGGSGRVAMDGGDSDLVACECREG